MKDRRKFLRDTAALTIAGLSIPGIVSAVTNETRVGKITLNTNDTILFQGDSITDAGRSKKTPPANVAGSLGNGYALLAAARLLNAQGNKNLTIHNRGISGNKVYQLAERWDADCLELKPNVLSILIGVNDFWHKLNGNYNGTVKIYQDDLTALLDRTKQKLPNVKLIIGEPFAIPGVKAVNDSWFPAFTEYQAAARNIAKQYKAELIPYQSIFEKASKTAPASYWTTDGVHTTLAGAALMAEAWLAVIK
jgi:lysophospholipase L1-like esterase